MLFWICVAALVHPTSLGVLSLLIPPALFAAWMTGRLQLWRADVIAGFIVLGTLFALAMSSLPDSWEHRDLWKAFGQATSWWQLWYAWAWTPIVLLPLAAAAFTWSVCHLVPSSHSTDVAGADGSRVRLGSIGLIPGAVGLAGTLVFFCASYFEWVPLWHRRYYVAALPLLAWTSGELSAICLTSLTHAAQALKGDRAAGKSSRMFIGCSGFAVSVSLLGFTLWYQGTMQTLVAGRLPVQLRGESWREAVAVVRDQIRQGDVVWLDSQLIEASFLRRPMQEAGAVAEAEWEYLGFPLRGPYKIDPLVIVACDEHDSWIRHHLENLPPTKARVWLVARSGSRSAKQFVKNLNRLRPVSAIERFRGGPNVQRLEFGE